MTKTKKNTGDDTTEIPPPHPMDIYCAELNNEIMRLTSVVLDLRKQLAILRTDAIGE